MALVDTGGAKTAFEIKSREQLFRIIQGAVEDEHSASSTYSAIIESCDDPEIKKTLEEIRNDELRHIWQLTDLLMQIEPNFQEQLGKAEAETGAE